MVGTASITRPYSVGLWLDDVHLAAHGERVFDEEEQVVHELLEIRHLRKLRELLPVATSSPAKDDSKTLLSTMRKHGLKCDLIKTMMMNSPIDENIAYLMLSHSSGTSFYYSEFSLEDFNKSRGPLLVSIFLLIVVSDSVAESKLKMAGTNTAIMSDSIYDLLSTRISVNRNGFYVDHDQDDGLNHGLTFLTDANWQRTLKKSPVALTRYQPVLRVLTST